jgi:protein phosphatase
MGSTLTAALVLGNNLLMAHIGDSRAYLIRDKQSVCLTADHTVVGDLVRAKLIPGEKIRTHAQRSILTKAVGIGLFAHPDVFSVKIQQDDYFVLCSDGVWSVIQDHEFARVVEESHGIDQVSLNIIKLAMDRETDDNASVVAFHIQELSPASDEEKRFSLSSRFTSGKR